MRKAQIIDGRAIAQDLVRRVRDDVTSLRKFDRLTPGLAVVLVGEDAASTVYVRTKTRRTEEVGIHSFMHHLPADVRQQEVLTLIHGLNADERVHGILVQLPLPDHMDEAAILAAVDPVKDVDGFHVINAGRLAIGDPQALVPCTPTGCLILIKSHIKALSGLKALIIGRSNIVGKPMAQLLLRENCTVTLAHSKTADLAGECRQADIVVAAVGRPRMVRGDWIKPGAVVIDVGINRVPGEDGKSKLVGDVDFHDALEVAGAVTPVPGGVGPMTVACLMRNTVVAACRQRGVPEPDDLAPSG